MRNKERKSYRLKGWDYRNPWWYYVTICTNERIPYFGEVVNAKMKLNMIGRIVNDEWENICKIRKNVELDEFIVMPNHLHGIIIINEIDKNEVNENTNSQNDVMQNYFSKISPKSGSLSAIVRSFKSAVTKALHEKGIEFEWQSRFYDRIIRNQKELDNIRRYINQNPLRWDINNDIDNIELDI